MILVSFFSAMVTVMEAVQLGPARKIRFESRKKTPQPTKGPLGATPSRSAKAAIKKHHDKGLIVIVMNWRLVWLHGEQMLGRLTVVAI